MRTYASLHNHFDREQVLWLAGWLEGEGTFWYSYTRGKRAHLVVSVGSLDLDVLAKGVRFTLCGNITLTKRTDKPFWVWTCNGRDAYAVMVAIYPFLGERRQQQIRKAVEAWKAVPVGNKWKTSCKNGHPFTPENTIVYPSQGRRRCRTCTYG